jgi:hypothetical protein
MLHLTRRSAAICAVCFATSCGGSTENDDPSVANPEETTLEAPSDSDDEVVGEAGQTPDPTSAPAEVTEGTADDDPVEVTADDDPVEVTADDIADDEDPADDIAEDTVEIVIPLAPVDEGALSFLIIEDPATAESLGDVEPIVRLALGEGYPNVMQFTLSTALLPADGTVLTATDLTLESVTSDGAGVVVTAQGDSSLELRAREPGTYRLELELSAEFDGAPARNLVESAVVEVISVTAVDWSTCSGPLYVVSGSPLGSSRLYPLGEDGYPFEPLNTEFDRGADVIVSALGGTRIEAPSGVDSLVVTGSSQTVEVRSNYGPITNFELIQPEDIDGLAPNFVSSVGGARGGGSSGVADGGEYTVDLAERPYLSVFPGARFGEHSPCGGPEGELFELRSTTPEVCTIEANGCEVRGCPTDRFVRDIANIVGSGTCTLELEAPTLNHGNGLSVSFSANFVALAE